LFVSAEEIPIQTPSFSLQSNTNVKELQGTTESSTNIIGITSIVPEPFEYKKMDNVGPLTPFTSFTLKRKSKSLPEAVLDNIQTNKQYKHISYIGRMQARVLRKINRYKPRWDNYY